MAIKEHQISIFEQILYKKTLSSAELQELPEILNLVFKNQNQEALHNKIVDHENLKELVDSVYEKVPMMTKKEEALSFYDDLLKGLDPEYYPNIDRSQLEQVLENDRQWLLTRGVVWNLEEAE